MLEVNNVCVSFRSERQEKIFGTTRNQVLFDVSLKVSQGTCLGILGESGSGKSTLGRVICCLLYTSYTNSDHLTINLLLNTDICSLGINFLYDQYRQYDVRQLRINNCEPFLLIGYICPDHAKLSKAAEWFISHFKDIL